MSSATNHRLTKSSSHRNLRSTAALDTSNPYYKKMSPTRKPKTATSTTAPHFKSTNNLSSRQQQRRIDEITSNALKNKIRHPSPTLPFECFDSLDLLERPRSCHFDIPFVIVLFFFSDKKASCFFFLSLNSPFLLMD